MILIPFVPTGGANDAAITKAAISRRHSLKLSVVAEGVCSDAQQAFGASGRAVRCNYFREAMLSNQSTHFLRNRNMRGSTGTVANTSGA